MTDISESDSVQSDLCRGADEKIIYPRITTQKIRDKSIKKNQHPGKKAEKKEHQKGRVISPKPKESSNSAPLRVPKSNDNINGERGKLKEKQKEHKEQKKQNVKSGLLARPMVFPNPKEGSSEKNRDPIKPFSSFFSLKTEMELESINNNKELEALALKETLSLNELKQDHIVPAKVEDPLFLEKLHVMIVVPAIGEGNFLEKLAFLKHNLRIILGTAPSNFIFHLDISCYKLVNVIETIVKFDKDFTGDPQLSPAETTIKEIVETNPKKIIMRTIEEALEDHINRSALPRKNITIRLERGILGQFLFRHLKPERSDKYDYLFIMLDDIKLSENFKFDLLYEAYYLSNLDIISPALTMNSVFSYPYMLQNHHIISRPEEKRLDTENPNDPNNPTNLNDPNDPNNLNDPNDPNNPNIPNNPNNGEKDLLQKETSDKPDENSISNINNSMNLDSIMRIRHTSILEFYCYFMSKVAYRRYFEAFIKEDTKWMWGIDLALGNLGFQVGIYDYLTMHHSYQTLNHKETYGKNMPSPLEEKKHLGEKVKFDTYRQLGTIIFGVSH